MRAGIAAAIAAMWLAFTRIDLRSWFAIAIVALVWRIIELVAAVPALLDNASFMQLITPITGAGGLLLIAAFLYASNKSSDDKTKALSDNAATMRAAGMNVGAPPAEGEVKPDVDIQAESVTVTKGTK